MADDKGSCSHPRMCPPETFADKIKTDKLSLAPPPPALARKPPDK